MFTFVRSKPFTAMVSVLLGVSMSFPVTANGFLLWRRPSRSCCGKPTRWPRCTIRYAPAPRLS